MSYLIYSADVYTKTELKTNNLGELCCEPAGSNNIGPLPTLFTQDGVFNHEANSYLFYQKFIKLAKDLSPCAKSLYAYYQFLEDNNLPWDHFPPVMRLKPTYQFRSHLLKQIKRGELAQSTASVRMNHIVNYYKWLMHDGYLKIKNEKEAPFKIEFVSIQSRGMLAHISPKFTVQTSDLRIKVDKDATSNNVRPLSPLSRESLAILTQHLPQAADELSLQILLSIDSGLRINEIATLTLTALDSARPLAESQHRYELLLSPQVTGVQTKYSKTRQIEISEPLLRALNEYRTSERRLKRINKLNEQIDYLENPNVSFKQETVEALQWCVRHEPLFISKQGNPVTAKSIEARWTEFRTQVKQQYPSFKHRFHDFRATYGTYRLNDLLEAKLPVVECMELLMGWMGHRNESTTWKYLSFLKRKEAFKVKFGLLDSIMHEALGSTNE
ncbi:site-specific integrase [Aeromonas caviae]|uniref:site-specific integrase n=1 Tax=Aeromonas caviae TaxID=648 RepID=UPI0008528BE1|nr:site-specific integrase [Aeromonas caviae]MEA9441829.1 site-specific integrase [Aeromonas caviae]OEG06503.1 integrase [Aeromonas caviae]